VNRYVRKIVTPEGIPLRLERARAGDRASAFFMDSVLQIAVATLVVLLAMLATRGSGAWSGALSIVVAFLIRNFYFILFELRWQGSTPGKRRLRIRVMDARGGPLRSDAIVVRNLMREVEVWIPLAALVAPQQLWPDAPGWARVACSVWLLLFAFFPLFNRDRLRIGDLVAGTLVVESPRALLLPDLGGRETQRKAKAAEEPETRFTQAQLEIYGEYELQVLEDVLRRTDMHRRQAMRAVHSKIARKIKWKGEALQPEPFLREFYAALRAHLENKMLLGKRKKDKFG